ncbi:MAG: rubrerythrin family protein [Candidatus Omnitrophota bacterium]
MKAAGKVSIALCFFIFVLAIFAYAEEGKSVKTKTNFPPPTATNPGAPTATPMIPPGATPAIMVWSGEKTTLDNLQTAFNGESNAHARYLVFAQKAGAEGYGKVANLFRAAARAEEVHFKRCAKVIKELGGVPTAKIEPAIEKSTAENLETAMKSEIYESTIMYPEFWAQSEKDQIKGATDAFEDIGKAEAVHAGLYEKARENLPEWKDKSKKFEVCTFCGNVVEKVNFKNCPVCGKSKKLYVSVR